MSSCCATQTIQSQFAPLIIKTGRLVQINNMDYQEITLEQNIASQSNNEIISGYIRRIGGNLLFLSQDSIGENSILSIQDKYIKVRPKPITNVVFFKFGVFTIRTAFNGYSYSRCYQVTNKYVDSDYLLESIKIISLKKDIIKLTFYYSHLGKMYDTTISVKTATVKRNNRYKLSRCI
jgi:hypothetical protein